MGQSIINAANRIQLSGNKIRLMDAGASVVMETGSLVDGMTEFREQDVSVAHNCLRESQKIQQQA